MKNMLSPDCLEQILPAIQHIAEMIRRSGRPDREDIKLLLMASDLNEEWMIDEVERWAEVLNLVRGESKAERREAAQRALMMRGVPEASAKLAVDTVAVIPEKESKLLPIRVNPRTINFGVLKPGQEAQMKLKVWGGPGRVKMESDMMEVHPETFGPEETILKVRIKGKPKGEQLLIGEKLVLENESERIEIPIIAHWMSAPAELTVSPGEALEEVIEEASDGDTIRLEAGEYLLNKCLRVEKTIRLIGAGMDQTNLICEGEGAVVQFEGDGTFAVSDLTFKHRGRRWADVVVAESGEIDIRRCRFTGAVRGKAEGEGGNGLRIGGESSGIVVDCESTDNEFHGICVEDSARLEVKGNICRGNGGNGITCLGSTSGTMRGNKCLKNNLCGIYIGGQARWKVEKNECCENELSGIDYFDRASGEVRDNECQKNGHHGIYTGQQATITLEGNTCRDNRRSGISCSGEIRGTVRNNNCTGNLEYGIYIASIARVHLTGNRCSENRKGSIKDNRRWWRKLGQRGG